MLTEFSIGNYQAFSSPQRVPLKPITLIFGPNSAGKSALLRSLLVARHAILNGKLSKSEGASERHPGAYADIVRNGSSAPISFGFTVQSEKSPPNNGLEISVAWKEKEGAGLETVEVTLKQNQAPQVIYSTNWNSKHLQITQIGDELAHLIPSARLESDAEGRFNTHVSTTIKNRLALQRNVALPGADADHFRIEASKRDEVDVLSVIEEREAQGKSTEKGSTWRRNIETAVESLKSVINTPIQNVDVSVRDALTKLTYHGPVRPICDEITKDQQAQPGLAEWWNLAADQKLRAEVNDWLASGIFKTKYRLEFDCLFPDSSLQQLDLSLSKKCDLRRLVRASFQAKLDTDQAFLESAIDERAPDMEDSLEDDYPDEDERAAVARDLAGGFIYDDSGPLGMIHYNSLLEDSNVDEIESFLIGGMNQILSSLRGQLKSIRGQDTAAPGSFDSAKVRFCSLDSSKPVAPSNMGIGFSQMMPLVASAFGSENRLIAIEQPELHVHPALQTELADLFIQSAKERGNRFLIETHSEHLILRVLRRIRESSDPKYPSDKQPLRPEDVAVLYVQPGENGSEVIELPVTEDGDFAVPWPGGFFAERSAELF